eukprot:3972109-Pleurochrysis_carterae.AAC.3
MSPIEEGKELYVVRAMCGALYKEPHNHGGLYGQNDEEAVRSAEYSHANACRIAHFYLPTPLLAYLHF